jgi:hypothetical protein
LYRSSNLLTIIPHVRNSICILLIWLTSVSAFAAPPSPEWLGEAGGPGYDSALAACADNNGNVIIAGSIGGTAYGITNSTGRNRAFVAKYSTAGALLWVRAWPEPPFTQNSQAQTLAVDAQDNIFVAGQCQTTLFWSDGTVYDYPYRLFVSKYDATGTLQWTMCRTNGNTTTNREGPVYVYASAVDTLGNFIVGGDFSGNAFIGNTNLHDSGNGWSDLYVAKFTPSGDTSWVFHVGSTGFDSVQGLTLTRSNRVVIAGYCWGPCQFGSYQIVGINGTNFIAELGTNGSVLALQTLDFRPRGGLAGTGNGEFFVWGQPTTPYRSALAKFAGISNQLWRVELTNTWASFPYPQSLGVDRYGNVWAGVTLNDGPPELVNTLCRFTAAGVMDHRIPVNSWALNAKFASDAWGNVFCASMAADEVIRLGSLAVTNTQFDPPVAQIFVAKITTPPPALSITATASGVELSWPPWASTVVPESCDALTTPPNWQPLTNEVVRTLSLIRVTAQRETEKRFFRLKLP